jgi:chromosome segregation ATPase
LQGGQAAVKVNEQIEALEKRLKEEKDQRTASELERRSLTVQLEKLNREVDALTAIRKRLETEKLELDRSVVGLKLEAAATKDLRKQLTNEKQLRQPLEAQVQELRHRLDIEMAAKTEIENSTRNLTSEITEAESQLKARELEREKLISDLKYAEQVYWLLITTFAVAMVCCRFGRN